jgi:hypothetical protein
MTIRTRLKTNTVRIITHVVASKYFWNQFISEKYKTPQSFKLHFLQKKIPLRNYTLLPVTAKLLDTFLEAIFWKPFHLFRPILNFVDSITKAPYLQCWFQSREQAKISCSQFKRVWGMLQCCHILLAKKSVTTVDRWAGALSWKRIQLLVLHFAGRFVLTAFLTRRRISVHISLFTVAIPMYYNRKLL